MSPEVVRVMTWMAAIVLAIGHLVPSPTAQIALAWTSGLFATSPLAFGSPKFKAIGVVIAVGAVWLTTKAYPQAGAALG